MPKRPSWKTKVAKVLMPKAAPVQLSLTEPEPPKAAPAQPVEPSPDMEVFRAALERAKELEDGLRFALAYMPRLARTRSEWAAMDKCRALLEMKV